MLQQELNNIKVILRDIGYSESIIDRENFQLIGSVPISPKFCP